MTSQEAAFILCYKWAGTSTQDSNFSLDILNVIVVRLEVNLEET